MNGSKGEVIKLEMTDQQRYDHLAYWNEGRAVCVHQCFGWVQMNLRLLLKVIAENWAPLRCFL